MVSDLSVARREYTKTTGAFLSKVHDPKAKIVWFFSNKKYETERPTQREAKMLKERPHKKEDVQVLFDCNINKFIKLDNIKEINKIWTRTGVYIYIYTYTGSKLFLFTDSVYLDWLKKRGDSGIMRAKKIKTTAIKWYGYWNKKTQHVKMGPTNIQNPKPFIRKY